MKKILIVGSGAKAYALAKRFTNEGHEVFCAPQNTDIREDKPEELLKFALENSVNLTVVCSRTAIKSDIATIFRENEQLIFAPGANSANFAINKGAGKKFLYRQQIPTPKFGIFEKQPLAADYIKTACLPVIIRTEESGSQMMCPTLAIANTFIDDLFFRGEKKIIIEDYTYGHEFTFYVLTDGFHAVPLVSAASYKFMSEGGGGLLTQGIGTFAPDYKVSFETENILLNRVFDILEIQTNYSGILGIECTLKEDESLTVTGFTPFLQDHDCQAVLNLIDESLYSLFESCAVGSFADDCERVNISDNSSVSCMLFASSDAKEITGLDEESEDIIPLNIKDGKTVKGKTMLVTKTAATLSRACKNLYEEIDSINYEGKKFRKDICKIIG
ncbi:MAG: hypothetical protein LBJ74_05265 [Heliobacteriaceae bacterium]|jgi:phosphoribosylamine-glycine ligase|nr:hypothetical protein [Heliobacteriaceae bacterium]